jgi:hypothetical protein
MRFKAGFLVGLGAGYVLGTRAGEERYQQIKELAQSVRENPGVQRFTGEMNRTATIGKERVSEAASRTVQQATEKAAEQASKAKEAVAGDKGAEAPAESPPTVTPPVSTTSASSGARPTTT